MAIDSEFEQRSREHAQSTLTRTLVALRRREHLSQRELAARVGMHHQSYRRIEGKPETTSLSMLGKIAKELGEPVWKLLKHADKLGRHF